MISKLCILQNIRATNPTKHSNQGQVNGHTGTEKHGPHGTLPAKYKHTTADHYLSPSVWT